MNHGILLSQHSMTDAVVCASCVEAHQDRVAELCLHHQFQKAFRKTGDTLNKLSEKGLDSQMKGQSSDGNDVEY